MNWNSGFVSATNSKDTRNGSLLHTTAMHGVSAEPTSHATTQLKQLFALCTNAGRRTWGTTAVGTPSSIPVFGTLTEHVPASGWNHRYWFAVQLVSGSRLVAFPAWDRF